MRSAAGGVGLLALVLLAGCIGFEDAQQEWCFEHPGACPEDGGEPDAGEPDAGEPDAGEPDAGEPDAGEPDAGEEPWVEGRACAVDEQCGTGALCHPAAKVCVRTCATAEDCPTSSPVCAEVLGDEGGVVATTVCQCTEGGAEEACSAAGEGRALACAKDTLSCVPSCRALGCEQGLVCEEESGQCIDPCGGMCAEGTVCDIHLAEPTCVLPCQWGTCPEAGRQVCERDGGLCSQGPACEGTGQSTCAYAQHCGAGGDCQEVPRANCTNFPWPGFDPATSRGPIIYAAELVGSDPDWCGGGLIRRLVRVSAYRVTGSWPETRDGLTDLDYVNSGGVGIPASQVVVSSSHYPVNGMQADITFSLCVQPELETMSFGAMFDNGNEYCQQLSF